MKNHARALALASLFILLLAIIKLGTLLTKHTSWASGTAVIAAIILTVAYDQRFAIGMSIFYCLFASFAAGPMIDTRLFLTMAAGAITCCFSLREIRTRMRLLEVSTLAAAIVLKKIFHIATSMTLLDYSDANQPLLKKLAMEAPGTFSHSLLIGSVAEAAAEAIGCNGLLCRVGAYLPRYRKNQ